MEKFKKEGFVIIEKVYSEEEIKKILVFLTKNNIEKKFGIRQFLKSNPELNSLVFNPKLLSIISNISPKAKVIKSIYFDKPPSANWIVNWHQDLTINVLGKVDSDEYINWRVLNDRTVVQPSIQILNNIFTIRIHLDECTKENGALRVVPHSHSKGIIPVAQGIEEYLKDEVITEVGIGGILIMKPLILHASRRTENNRNRRVLHIEFSDSELPDGLVWKEGQEIF